MCFLSCLPTQLIIRIQFDNHDLILGKFIYYTQGHPEGGRGAGGEGLKRKFCPAWPKSSGLIILEIISKRNKGWNLKDMKVEIARDKNKQKTVTKGPSLGSVSC